MNDGPNFIVVLVILAFYFVIFGVPIMQILKRTGFSRAWVLVTLIPILALIFLWIFAFKRWPVEGDT